MSGFKALNIESDDESDVEIDDTKEIQIEDALKLYQNALKYHADGPGSFEQAAEAYQQLFQSEIFKYPESQPELRRIELYGPLIDGDDFWDDFEAGGTVVPSVIDAGPSTLPQILYLSHKNYALFKLDYLRSRLDTLHENLNQVLAEASSALEHFVHALDKDDSDLDLWRRTATVGIVLDSKRVARFCLEAVLDGDDEGLNNILSTSGLMEGLVGEQLRDLIDQIHDQLSTLQAPPSIGKQKVMSSVLRQRLNTYDSIVRKAALKSHCSTPKESQQPHRLTLKAPTTWADMGEMLLRQLTAEQRGTGPTDSSPLLAFDLSTVLGPETLSPDPITSRKVRSLTSTPSPQVALPDSINEQFPGLDRGQPTVQPHIATADEGTRLLLAQTSTDDDMADVKPATMTLPSRKRSADAAGLGDAAIEEGRSKSKRLRARDSNVDTGDTRQAIIDANIRWTHEQQLNEFRAADDWMFETVGNLFEKIGVVGFEAGKEVRQGIRTTFEEQSSADAGYKAVMQKLQVARSEILGFLNDFTEQLGNVLVCGGESLDAGNIKHPTGKNSYSVDSTNSKLAVNTTPLSEDGLVKVFERVNRHSLLTQEVAWEWLKELLQPGPLHPTANSYTRFLWPEALKTMVVRVLVNFDVSIQDRAKSDLETMANRFQERTTLDDHVIQQPNHPLVEMIQTIFELHLDIYTLIKAANSGVDMDTIAGQADRLQRWAELAREALSFRHLRQDSLSMNDELNLRFIWATTFYIGSASDVTQDHVIECMNDLRRLLVKAGEPTIHLQNNAIMPELSVAALDKEISRLTTKDFFLKITDQGLVDPVAVIESLEPLLESLGNTTSGADCSDDTKVSEPPLPADVPPELVLFLQKSEMSVRLLLWQRLRDAYLAIDYKPMVVVAYFRMMRMVLDELSSEAVAELNRQERQVTVLTYLRLLQEISVKIYDIVQSSDTALDCIDENMLKLAVTSFGEVLQLLQVFNVFEDSLRVGQNQPPAAANGLPYSSFAAVKNLAHDMQVHIWIVLFALFKEAIAQNAALYPTPAEDKFDFLRCVHRNLGIRGICGGSKRAFVRTLKHEFFQMTHVDGYDSEQAQVLYDLYGLDCFLNPSYELIEHDCTHDAFLDRGVALQVVDLLLAQASKLPIKELVKHSLKDTIDKVHGTVSRKKPSETILRNREVCRAFLKSPINPLDLFGCLKGNGNNLLGSPVPKEDAKLALKGWYFLMGHISLTKFRSQKRTAPAPTEDVEIAIAFFMQDLEYSLDNWETWFRLAQAYDTKIEECVVWSAEKLNSSMPEVVQLQRTAIHCYTMATALANRSANLAFETSEKMTELYSDFAFRLYASSREPFSMLAFALDETEKFVSGPSGIGKSRPFAELSIYTAWKLAKVLFQRALTGKPRSWQLHFMLGKCLWKMHSASEVLRGSNERPSAQRILECFIRAIELLPDKKDSREKREPTLEPHYKLVSVVHKMISKGELSLEQARGALDHSRYARTATFPQDVDEWVPHVLAILKNLRTADKSNWHHRMVARAAQIIYDDSDPQADTGPSQNLGAMGAKHELTQQMFTKTMVLQVWRPESERAGRHFVYTARYTRFFVKILEQLKDRTNLEMLARRMRRRPHDVFEHSLVWQDICNAYLRLLRGYATLTEGLETSTFSNLAHEEFLSRKEPLEKWMQAQDSSTSPALDVLREVQELKKINQSMMKPGPIDDLIGDSYAYLFNTIGRQLWEEERKVKEEEEAQRLPPPVASPPRNPMMSLNRVMNMDGASESTAISRPVTAPIAAKDPDQPPSRKKIGVGRREIRTCAESCFQKAVPVQAKNVGIAAGTRVQVVIDNNRPAGGASAGTSAPGSVHDSADDESELSELEEEDEEEEEEEEEEGEDDQAGHPKVMFPGLLPESSEKLHADETVGKEPEVAIPSTDEDVIMERWP